MGSSSEAVYDVVELRVHGVSGTPPEELLDRPLVRQVAGDRTAGFFRPRLESEWRDEARGTPGPAGPLLEGYSWGGLTSGSPSRALWLALLPFTLINVAPRLRPVPRGDPDAWPFARWLVGFLCRVLAISMTVTLTFGFVGVGVSTLGWQCDASCPGLPGILEPLLGPGDPSRRVAWGALLPIIALVVLAALSWRNSIRYDMVRPEGVEVERAEPLPHSGSRSEPRLDHPLFWYGRFPVARLRQLHLQAGLAGAALAIGLSSPLGGTRIAVVILAVATAVFVLVALGLPSLLERAHAGRPVHLAGWIPAGAAAVGAMVGIAQLTSTDAVQMPRYDDLLSGWFTAQSIIVGLLGVVVIVMAIAEKRRTPKRAMWSLGTFVISMMALYLGGALTSGAVILTAAWARTKAAVPGPGEIRKLLTDAPEMVPRSMLVAGVGVLLVAVLVVISVVLALIWAAVSFARGGTNADKSAAAHAEDRAEATEPVRFAHLKSVFPELIRRRRAAISRDIWIGRRVDFVAGYLAVLTLIVGIGGTTTSILYGFGAWTPNLDSTLNIIGYRIPMRDAVAWGAWLTGVLLVAIIALGSLAFRVKATRKSVGIVWDLASFWPRDTHPLSPPCYAERTVPELAYRVRWYVGEPEPGRQRNSEGVVLAAHSQGTVISMAVLLGPARAVIDRVALLTFGNVLRRLYSRFFPVYFGTEDFAALARSLGSASDFPTSCAVSTSVRWRNLWRRTDYLGGRMCDPLAPSPPAAVSEPGMTNLDIELDDPVFLPVPGDLTPPPAGRHSAFPRDPAFQQTIEELITVSFGRAGGEPAPTHVDGNAPVTNPPDVMS